MCFRPGLGEGRNQQRFSQTKVTVGTELLKRLDWRFFCCVVAGILILTFRVFEIGHLKLRFGEVEKRANVGSEWAFGSWHSTSGFVDEILLMDL